MRGGSRPGAGRKPKGEAPARVVNIDGKPRADVLPASMQQQITTSSAPLPVIDPLLTDPPGDLSEPRQAFWKTWAPQAIAEGTLTAATVLGFRSLSREYVIVEELAAVIEAKAHGWEDALNKWLKAEQRLDSTMARFKLTALGKSAAKPKTQPSSAVAWGSVAKR